MTSPHRRARLAGLIALPFAHRGLHGPGRLENSRAAFEAAIAAGHGIELDVQASREGYALVIHDYRLERLTEGFGEICGMVAAELARIRLKDSPETVPTLREVLDLIGGRVPLLIEVKSPGRRPLHHPSGGPPPHRFAIGRNVDALSGDVAGALYSYEGPVAVMSFNPEVGRWFARHAPDVLRGLVVTETGRKWRGALTRRLALWRSRADFLAYDIRDLPSRFATRQRTRGLPVLTWTCRAEADRARAALHADQIIYEQPRA